MLLKLRGLKANLQSVPKLGGFKSITPKLEVVNLQDLETHFADKDVVSIKKLLQKGLIKTSKNGVKILGMGKISKSLTLKINKISESAKQAVEKAGGKIILLSPVIKGAKKTETEKDTKDIKKDDKKIAKKVVKKK